MVHEGLRRAALVVLEELPTVGARRAREVALRGGGRNVGFVARGGLARVGHAPDAVRTAVVADAAVVDVVDHHIVRIHIGDVGDVHIGHGTVVEVAVVIPVAAHETDADITEAVVDAAVEADVRPPVAGVPQIDAVHETPVARRPQRAGVWRQHPGARHPEIAVAVQAPVAGHPDIAVGGRRRLGVDGQGRRRGGAAVHRRQIGVGGIRRVIGGVGRGRGRRWRRIGLGQGGGADGQRGQRGQRLEEPDSLHGVHGISWLGGDGDRQR